MATPISQLKATASELAAKTPANGLLIWDETNKRWVGGDGVTPSGIPMAKASDVIGLKQGYPITPGGRLSLVPATPVPVADVAGGATLYYPAFGSPFCPVYDGTQFNVLNIPDNLQLALDAANTHALYHASGFNYDVFAITDGFGGIKLGTGPSWAAGAVAGSAVARGTGAGSTDIETYKGLLVNKNAITLRIGANAGDTVAVAARCATYLGSFRTTADGQATDTNRQRLLFNAYNAVQRRLYYQFTGGDSNWSAASYVAMNHTLGNRIEVLFGLAGVLLDARMVTTVQAAAACSSSFAFGLDGPTGINPTTGTPAADELGYAVSLVSGLLIPMGIDYNGYPGLGFHFLQPLMYGSTTGTVAVTWFGVAGKGGIKGTYQG